MSGRGTALLVDADPGFYETAQSSLSAVGVQLVGRAATLAQALESLSQEPADLLLLDAAEFQRDSGALGVLRDRWSDVRVIAVAPLEQRDLALNALRAGADDLLDKPLNLEQLRFVVERVLCLADADAEAEPPASLRPRTLVGETPAMQKLLSLVKKAAAGTATVLLRGETGTGKGLVANALHEQSPRAAGPFVKVHCSALPEQLLESELFGYERGAFTGATQRKPGRVELAEGGTLFLDEIGDITAATQVKLLRLLQEREFERLGGTRTVRADVRFIAATHRDLDGMVKQGTFREDLFYRLNIVPIWVPPLRTRRDDIERLARQFCRSFAQDSGKPSLQLEDDAIELLRKQRWPGNVRQLENLVERLVVLNDASTIRAADVEAELSATAPFHTQWETQASLLSTTRSSTSGVVPLSEAVQSAERRALKKALEHTRGNRTLAARLLRVSRATLYNKLREYGLE